MPSSASEPFSTLSTTEDAAALEAGDSAAAVETEDGAEEALPPQPWHWRYVGPENAALLCQSGLCFEDAIALLEQTAAGEAVPGQDPAKTV